MIKIFTVNDSNPEFVELQVSSFIKYLQEDFEFIVLNGGEALGTQPEKAKEVSRICHSLSVQVIDVQRDLGIEAARAKYSPEGPLFDKDGRYTRGVGGFAPNYIQQWGWEKIISKEQGPVCFLHSDVFLIEPIKLTDYLQEYSLCSVIHVRSDLNYLWDAFLLIEPSKLSNLETIIWWPSFVEGRWIDAGGYTYYYLKAHPEIKLLSISELNYPDSPAVDFHPSRYQFFQLPDGKKILHYLAGSRWFTTMKEYGNFSTEKSNEYHEKKLAWARKIVSITEI